MKLTIDKIEKYRETGRTLQSIGDKYGVSPQRVWDILNEDKMSDYHKTYKARTGYNRTDKQKNYMREYMRKYRLKKV